MGGLSGLESPTCFSSKSGISSSNGTSRADLFLFLATGRGLLLAGADGRLITPGGPLGGTGGAFRKDDVLTTGFAGGAFKPISSGSDGSLECGNAETLLKEVAMKSLPINRQYINEVSSIDFTLVNVL